MIDEIYDWRKQYRRDMNRRRKKREVLNVGLGIIILALVALYMIWAMTSVAGAQEQNQQAELLKWKIRALQSELANLKITAREVADKIALYEQAVKQAQAELAALEKPKEAPAAKAEEVKK